MPIQNTNPTLLTHTQHHASFCVVSCHYGPGLCAAVVTTEAECCHNKNCMHFKNRPLAWRRCNCVGSTPHPAL